MKILKSSSLCFVLIASFLFTGCQKKKEPEQPKVKLVTLEVENHPVELQKTRASHEGDNVHISLQDQNGDLWFGTTAEGVFVFDGASFRQFTTDDGLSGNFIFDLMEDDQGNIWIGTDNGLTLYDGESFRSVFITEPTHSIRGKMAVFSIMQDNQGLLWICTVEGVYTYDGKAFTHFEIDENGAGFMSDRSNMEYIMQDKAGHYWFGSRTKSGVFRFDGNNITRYDLEMLDGHDWAWPVLQDQRGTIWFNNWGGVYRYDGASFSSVTHSDGLIKGAIMRIIEDDDGKIWFGGAGGLCSFDGKQFTHFLPFDQGVWSLQLDQAGVLWVGARNTELYQIKNNRLFNHTVNVSSKEHTQPN